jgi:uroporphyrinogen-III decarboxylase
MKMPGRDLPEDDLIQIDEKELFGREDYEKIAALGWNGFWREHYPKIGRKSMEAVGDKLKNLLNIYAQQVDKCKTQGIPVLVGATVDSLMMAFSLCRTITQFTVDLFEVPGKVKAAMDACCDDLIQNALDTINISKIPLAWIILERSSAQIYRLEIFEKFELPYLQRYVDAFISSGIIPWFHMDTDWTRNLPYFKKFPKGTCVADLDSTTNIFKAKDILAGHMCVSGDVPAGLLTLGTQAEVRDYCKKLIQIVGKGGGFFLTTGCECPIDAKFENVKAMVDSVLEI